MRTQVWIIAAAFFLFGVVAWVFQQTFSVVYLGLMLMGIAGFAIGGLSSD